MRLGANSIKFMEDCMTFLPSFNYSILKIIIDYCNKISYGSCDSPALLLMFLGVLNVLPL